MKSEPADFRVLEPGDPETRLRAMLNPRSAAIVGVSRDPGKIGSRIARNIIAGGFRGEIYLVHREEREIMGRPVYRSLRDIGAPIDVVFVAVPAESVRQVLEDAVGAGAGGAVVISSGFAEMGAAGGALQDDAVRSARAAGLRIVGPNCFGIINAAPEAALHGTFGSGAGAPGNVAFASQSGALGIVMLDEARERGLGISQFVSIGNRVDVSSNDLLEVWGADDRIDVIGLYLESFGQPERFAAIARRVGKYKPIIALKAGRTKAGRRAAASHTAALLASDAAASALFEAAGIIRVDTSAEFIDLIRLSAAGAVPRGRRVGAATNAGGPGILFADTAEANGLTLPIISAERAAVLRETLPHGAGIGNPIDVTAGASPDEFARGIESVSGDIDAAAAVFVPIGLRPTQDYLQAMARAFGNIDPAVAVVAIAPMTNAPAMLPLEGRPAAPVFRYPEAAALALARWADYGEYCQALRREVQTVDPEVRGLIRQMIERLRHADEARWLTWDEIVELLAIVEISVVSGRTVELADAESAADAIGYPVVMKMAVPGLIHKSDIGGVLSDIKNQADIRAGIDHFRSLAQAHRFELRSVLVQQFIPSGRRMFVGAAPDPTFGPVVACGLGGVEIEVLRDTALGIPPIDAFQAARMVGRLRAQALLEPFRGAPAHDRGAFERIIVGVSWLLSTAPEIKELDLNPVAVLPERAGAVVLDARVRLGTASRPSHGAA